MQQSNPIKHVVIVGGGTAGWLTAGLLAARLSSRLYNSELTITLCESPDMPTVGVGEGSWPTLRSTLHTIGISETDFIRQCNVSFKQGSRFIHWENEHSSQYDHPFDVPEQASHGAQAQHWLHTNKHVPFSQAYCLQSALANQQLAPKLITTAEYSGFANYGYHLDAGLFAKLLREHCVNNLQVKHTSAKVKHVIQDQNGDISCLQVAEADRISANEPLNTNSPLTHLTGDLFIDCTGFSALLLEKTLGVKNTPVNDVLFANNAIATHVPYATDYEPIESFTLSTAQDSGWIWDIGLPNRRGVGYVYSDRYSDDESAEDTLLQYIRQHHQDTDSLSFKHIRFTPGYKQQFWKNNCVAIGLSAGFIEPLEASALVLVEMSANMLAEQLPNTRSCMDVIAKRFNQTFTYRWQHIIDFLKLHYVLSKRTSAFWKDNRAQSSVPDSLKELLALWQHKVPDMNDFPAQDEVFQAASYQFVLYGAGFKSQLLSTPNKNLLEAAEQQFLSIQGYTSQLTNKTISNRDLLSKIYRYGLQKR